MTKFNDLRIENFCNEIKTLWEKTGKINTSYHGKNQEIKDFINTFEYPIRDYLLDIFYRWENEFKQLIEYKYNGKNTYTSNKIKTIVSRYKKILIKVCNLENSKNSFKQLPVCLLINFDFENVRKNNFEYQKEVNFKQTNYNRIPIKRSTIDNFMLHCNDLIDSNSIYKKALAIAFFTGKRLYSEIFYYSQYIKINDTKVRFFNLAKCNDKSKFTDINLIGISSDKLISNLNEIREYIESRKWFFSDIEKTDLTKKLSPSINQYFNLEIINFFKKHERKNIELINELSPHTLRSLHCLISNEIYNIDSENRIVDFNYESLILGHFSFLGEQNVNPYDLTKSVKDYTYKISNSTESYHKFILI